MSLTGVINILPVFSVALPVLFRIHFLASLGCTSWLPLLPAAWDYHSRSSSSCLVVLIWYFNHIFILAKWNDCSQINIWKRKPKTCISVQRFIILSLSLSYLCGNNSESPPLLSKAPWYYHSYWSLGQILPCPVHSLLLREKQLFPNLSPQRKALSKCNL